MQCQKNLSMKFKNGRKILVKPIAKLKKVIYNKKQENERGE